MTDSAGRIFGLDVLRAMAVLFVVYGHGYNYINGDVSVILYLLPSLDGVTLFFVLSGFLIGRILLRTVAKQDFNGAMLVQFWIRRWFRTLPNYFVVLVFLVAAYSLLDRPQPEGLWRYFLFAQNIAWPHPEFFVEAWSLSVEEWFYLCIPIPLYLATRLPNLDKRRLMLLWIAIVIVAVTAFRIYRVVHFGYSTVVEWDSALRRQVVTRMDGLMFGVLGAYLSLYEQGFWRKAAKPAFLAGLVLFGIDKALSTAQSVAYLNYFNLTAGAAATLLLLPALSSWRTAAGRVARAVTFVSIVSYSMYLTHLAAVQGVIMPFVIRAIGLPCPACGQSHLLQYAVYWVVTLLCSFLLYRYFARPATLLRERWRRAPSAPLTAFAVSAPSQLAPTDSK